MITSARNSKILWIKALQTSPRKRREEKAYVIEGIRLLEEAAEAGVVPLLILHTPDLSGRGLELLERFAAGPSEILATESHALEAASDTRTPQGILAVCPLSEPRQAAPEDLTPESLALLLDHLRDPGNLGTILRTAAALGVRQILLPPGSADPYSPKVLRGGMGAHFQLALQPIEWEEVRALLQRQIQGQTIQVLLAAPGEGRPFTEVDFLLPTMVIIGGEAEGASAEARALDPRPIHIPMPGGVESLNAAVAAGILLYEIARQRSL
jgi:TrmH family RNA methyltransferase